MFKASNYKYMTRVFKGYVKKLNSHNIMELITGNNIINMFHKRKSEREKWKFSRLRFKNNKQKRNKKSKQRHILIYCIPE